jgi:DNA-directed RNA polymerase specialized sigma24 family protein
MAPRSRNNIEPDDLRSLEDALRALSERERLVCVWLRLGFTVGEVAHSCGGSASEVQAIYKRAAERIRKLRRGR